jgi:hypothetical protein
MTSQISRYKLVVIRVTAQPTHPRFSIGDRGHPTQDALYLTEDSPNKPFRPRCSIVNGGQLKQGSPPKTQPHSEET